MPLPLSSPSAEPSAERSPSELQVTPNILHYLAGEGVLTRPHYLAAHAMLREDDTWQNWTLRLLFALFLMHFLSGIVFFFAYNWTDLTQWEKFSTLEIGLLISLIVITVTGLNRFWGPMLLVIPILLLGTLLAVYGQIYQTGANSWELFVNWTLLALPWVLISCHIGPWAVWTTIASLAIYFWAEQWALPLGWATSNITLGTPVPFLASILLLREIAQRRGWQWIQPIWTRWVLFSALLALLMPTVWEFVADKMLKSAESKWSFFDLQILYGWIAFGLYGVIAGSGYVYFFRRRDLFCLALLNVAGAGVLFCIALSVLDRYARWGDALMTISLALWGFCIAGAALILLNSWRLRFAGDMPSGSKPA